MIPAPGHIASDWTTVEEPTSTMLGRQQRTCVVCGTGFHTTEYGFGKSVLLRRCQCICRHNCGSQRIGQRNSYGTDLGFTVSFS